VHADREVARPLAEACARKTLGNPFFLNQLLREHYDRESIRFDAQARRWTWDMEAVERSNITENVVEMMAEKIHGLPEGTRRALTTAACIGGTFDLKTLALARGDSPGQVASDLWVALEEELVRPLGEGYEYLPGVTKAAGEVAYRFLHDRVQQAAYSLLGAGERQELHLLIGRSMLETRAPSAGRSSSPSRTT
jgi:predicted ATPase